jgi:hypothetical protein
MVDALKKVKSKYLFFIFGGLSAVILLKNLWDLLSLNTGDLEDVALLGFAIFFATGVFVFAIKYFLFYRRQNQVPAEIQRECVAASSIRVATANKIARAIDAETSRFTKPTLLWRSIGLEIFDVTKGFRLPIPYREINWANFSHASASRDLLGYLRLSIAGFEFKTGIWVFDGFGKSFPIGMDREDEFLTLIGALRN